MIASELIKRGAKYYPNHTGVMYEEESATFQQVYRNSNKLANALLRLGLQKGDRVAFLLANSLQSIEIDFAILLSGLVRVPLNTRLSEVEHLHMIQETEAKAILFTEEFSNRVASLRTKVTTVSCFIQTNGVSQHSWIVSKNDLIPTVTDDEPSILLDESDLATIQYTSGTTGKLKAAVHTQGTWSNICNNLLACLRIDEGDIMLHAAPLTHASGTLVLPHWLKGSANAILSGFNPEQFLQTVEKTKATTLNLVPTMIVVLLSNPEIERYSFESVKNIIYGASPMPRETLRRGLALWGPKFIQYYGQTEAPLILSMLDVKDHVGSGPEYEQRLLSCGRPVTSAAIEIIDEYGREVSTGTIGEITVKTNQAMIEYWRAPEITNDTMKNGWIHTRDMGYVDEKGYLYLVDRKSDMIITGGFNVYPREVEEVLYQHPAVMEAAAVGVPDEKWVETVKAFVVLQPNASITQDELIEFCKYRLASYKKPTSVEFVESLPKTAVGKVLRRVLREPYWKDKDHPNHLTKAP